MISFMTERMEKLKESINEEIKKNTNKIKIYNLNKLLMYVNKLYLKKNINTAESNDIIGKIYLLKNYYVNGIVPLTCENAINNISNDIIRQIEKQYIDIYDLYPINKIPNKNTTTNKKLFCYYTRLILKIGKIEEHVTDILEIDKITESMNFWDECGDYIINNYDI